MKRLLLVLLPALLLAQSGARVTYTKDDRMQLPKDYRQWTFLSSGLNMTYAANGGGDSAHPRFENVFVNPEAYQAFLKTGSWPDKTAFILEVRNSDSKVSINKDGRVQTDIAVIEAHVRDTARFKETGGWGFYGFTGDALKKGEGIPFAKTADCFTCHQQNGAVETTFVQFYPTLIEVAKQHKTYKSTE
jgi:hypothetical protein